MLYSQSSLDNDSNSTFTTTEAPELRSPGVKWHCKKIFFIYFAAMCVFVNDGTSEQHINDTGHVKVWPQML